MQAFQVFLTVSDGPLAECAKARATLAEIDAVLPDDLETLRFYRGSPAQFAATVMSRGTLLGTYCGAEVRSFGRDIYDTIRDSEARK